jgi:cell division protein FtsL
LLVKNKVRVLERQLFDLKTEISTEKEKIVVLKTELTYLSRPDRIRSLAEKHLNLEPARIKQVIVPNDRCHEKQNVAVVQLNKWRYKYSPSSYEVRQTKLAQNN